MIAVAVVLALGVVGLAVAPLANAAGGATITKTVEDEQASYAVGEQVTYRLNVQCSALETGCGITTVTDVLDTATSRSPLPA